MAKIQMPDNQSFELDDSIAGDDSLLRGALAAAYPDAANATFERSGGKDGKPLVVKVTKKAGTKGAHAVIADLLAAPEYVNPAVAMQQKIGAMGDVSHLEMLAMKSEIETAVERGGADLRYGYDVEKALIDTPAIAGNSIPRGF